MAVESLLMAKEPVEQDCCLRVASWRGLELTLNKKLGYNLCDKNQEHKYRERELFPSLSFSEFIEIFLSVLLRPLS